MIEICVIIPMYGKDKYTRKCIDLCVKNAGVPHDILVVDDGSPFPFLDERVKTLRLDKNSGFTNAVNQGLLYAQKLNYKYVLVLNNDTEPHPNFLKILHEVLEENAVIGMVSSARVMPTKAPANLELYGTDLIRGYQLVCDNNISDQLLFVRWVPLCCVLIRMECLRHIGLLDRNMRTWCSDNDICIRANFGGWNVAVHTGSRVYHHHQVTTGLSTVPSAGVKDDQSVLLEKMTNLKYAELMRDMPLDCEQNTYGELSFRIVKKEGAYEIK